MKKIILLYLTLLSFQSQANEHINLACESDSLRIAQAKMTILPHIEQYESHKSKVAESLSNLKESLLMNPQIIDIVDSVSGLKEFTEQDRISKGVTVDEYEALKKKAKEMINDKIRNLDTDKIDRETYMFIEKIHTESKPHNDDNELVTSIRPIYKGIYPLYFKHQNKMLSSITKFNDMNIVKFTPNLRLKVLVNLITTSKNNSREIQIQPIEIDLLNNKISYGDSKMAVISASRGKGRSVEYSTHHIETVTDLILTKRIALHKSDSLLRERKIAEYGTEITPTCNKIKRNNEIDQDIQFARENFSRSAYKEQSIISVNDFLNSYSSAKPE